MTTTLRPLHDRILVEPMSADEKTAGGIIIPDTAQEKPHQGKVVAVGKGTTTPDGAVVALTVQAGDMILYGKYAGTEVKVDGKDYLIMRESDVLGIAG
ncbi:MAG: co-chaperone GroES [Alphaproteobacteria bacterium]|nr:co-chaperone GroES [Alphaproteobacteria bacterium]